MEVLYSSKVIDRAPYISDMGILAKAYLRRGMALESLEKYNDAKEDFLSVKELQPSNKQASQGLTRIYQALRDLKKVDLSDVEVRL